MSRAILLSLLLAALASLISAECPNACSSHGKCGAYDACQCYRNWMSNDCSERICQFGLAHVDSPKGDLDSSSGKLYSPQRAGASSTAVADPIITGDAMYPKGTWEQFPNMMNSLNVVLDNTAHDYMECSNKGICDRSTGVCACFDGYDGSSCQRASCPSSSAGFCSGHGMCYSAREIAMKDYNNSYNLWDAKSTMGCICDAGYAGADCAEQVCKYGADPLYGDEKRNMRYSNFTFALYAIDKYDSTNDAHAATDGLITSVRSALWKGNYSIVFYDHFGKGWWTDPIDIHADCDTVTDTLEKLPNNVIPSGSVRCSMDYGTIGAYIPESNSAALAAATATATITPKKPTSVIGDGYPIELPSVPYGTDPVASAGTAYFPFTGLKMTLAFPQNAGKLRQPWLDLNLDGSRPTLVTGYAKTSTAADIPDAYKIRQWVYPNGVSGEDQDLVPDYCEGVTVTLKDKGVWTELNDISNPKLLKICLGDADGNPSNNNANKYSTNTQDALYNWDYGIEKSGITSPYTYSMDDLLNPHLIKLVDTSIASETRLCTTKDHQFTGVNNINTPGYCYNKSPPGFYAVLFYDPKADSFNLLSSISKDYTASTKFNIFTSTGYLTLSSKTTEAFTAFHTVAASPTMSSSILDLTSMYTNVVYTYYTTVPSVGVPGLPAGEIPNVDCETATRYTSPPNQCIEKGDYVMVIDTYGAAGPATLTQNPKYMNVYQVMKISRENRENVAAAATALAAIQQEIYRYQIVLDMSLNARYYKTDADASNARVYKFTPPVAPVNFVGECSLRGTCDTTSGTCKCFSGYTGDNCAVMNALAL